MTTAKRIAKGDLHVAPTGDSGAYRLEGGGVWYIGKANRFLRALGVRGLSTHTLRAYAYDLVILGRWLRAERLNMKSLTQATLIEFIAYQRVSDASAHSINRRLITIGSFYLFCYDRDIPSARGTSTPARHYIGKKHDANLGLIPLRRSGRRKLRVKAPRKLVEPLERHDVNRFLEHVVRYRDLAVTLLMLFSGLRSCEVLALRLADLRLGERAILVRGKGNKQRTVPVVLQLVDAIERYRRLERPDDSKTDRLFVVLQGKRRGQPMTSPGLRSIFRYRRRSNGPRRIIADAAGLEIGVDKVLVVEQWPIARRYRRQNWFFRNNRQHERNPSKWVIGRVIAMNNLAVEAIEYLARRIESRAVSPDLPSRFDQRFGNRFMHGINEV